MRVVKGHAWIIASVLAVGLGGCCDSDHPLGVSELTGRGPTSVPLGAAASFGVLAGSAVTNTGATIVTGDLGVAPGSAVSGFPTPGTVTGTIYTGTDAEVVAAQAALTTAFNDAQALTTGAITVSGDLAGQTLTPGLYTSTSSLANSGNLTLNALGDPTARFVIQMASTLTTGPGSQVILAGGARAENIIWVVGSSATLGTNSVMKGNILAATSITMNTGARLDGRALAQGGGVTLDANAVTVP